MRHNVVTLAIATEAVSSHNLTMSVLGSLKPRLHLHVGEIKFLVDYSIGFIVSQSHVYMYRKLCCYSNAYYQEARALLTTMVWILHEMDALHVGQTPRPGIYGI